MVAVNRAVAIGFADGPEAGLAALPDDPRLERYQPLHAARAELLRRAGDVAGADAALQAAIELSASEAERCRAAPARQRRRAQRAREREPRRDQQRALEAVRERRVAARAGEHRDRDRDPEHAAELAQRAVDARGLADVLRATALTAALVVAGSAIETPAPATISAGIIARSCRGASASQERPTACSASPAPMKRRGP